MKKVIKTITLGVLAGFAIGIGSLSFILFSYLNLKLIGSITFSIGLLLVCFLSLNLYTGKIGFVFENNKKSNLSLILIYIGNLIGGLTFGYLCYVIFKDTEIMNTIIKVASSRMINSSSSLLKSLSMSFMCGSLVFLAVYGFKNINNKLLKTLWIIVNVTTFVYSGMEHCIANIIYISMGNMICRQTLINIAITTLGNSIGSIVIYLGISGIKNPAKK